MSRTLLFFLASMIASAGLWAQDRPLRTVDAETVPAGMLRAEVGMEFLRNIDFPLSGLSGDLTSAGVINFRMGVGSLAEVQIEGSIQDFLDIHSQGISYITPLQLSGANSTHDTGDYSLSVKLRVLKEKGRRPGVALKTGFTMPNSNEKKGIGNNTLAAHAILAVGKQWKGVKLFGNAGVEVIDAPNALHAQNDVVRYGGALAIPAGRRVEIVGEVAGRYSPRTITVGLVGTESRGEARMGVRIAAGGFTWDVAGIAGLCRDDPGSGITFGVRKELRIFHLGGEK
ncbi:MAG: transporter [Acidobacteriia bacterium]|nr:transporter [Terriglobia bacterium]